MKEPRAGRSTSGSEPAADAEGKAVAQAEAGAEAPEGLEELGFEAALDELEQLVDRLEGGDLALEQALATFERGVALSRRCAELLERAERRIEVLVRERGGLAVRPFEGDVVAAAPEES